MEPTTLHLHTGFSLGPVDDRVFGGFLEHMGRAVYGGIFEPSNERADEFGCRRDVCDNLKQLGLTTVRYPGGNFVSGYHWRDGVGATESRPRLRSLPWRSIEPNTFGTCEFVTADQISGGRIEIAVGAGVAPGGPAKPLTHLRDTVHTLRASLQDAANPPGWVSTPHILLAGSGDKLLRTGGELADIVGFAGPFPHPSSLPPGHIPLLSPTAADDRIAAVRAGAGDRFDQIELNVGAEVRITGDRQTAAEEAHRIHSYLSVDEILASPKFLAGTPDEIADQLIGHRARFGLSSFATIGVTTTQFAPVICALREGT